MASKTAGTSPDLLQHTQLLADLDKCGDALVELFAVVTG